MTTDTGLSKEAAAVYDRQIRLWGRGAQTRLMSARVVVIGAGPLGAEVAKNLALAGVGALDLVDTTTDTPATDADYLFVSAAGATRAEQVAGGLAPLNPLVAVSTPAAALVEGAALVVSCGAPLRAIEGVAAECREKNVPFLACRTHGFMGIAVADLGNAYAYAWEKKSGEKGCVVWPVA
jgi:ubiquitin-like 1-activating enzyme E1 A